MAELTDTERLDYVICNGETQLFVETLDGEGDPAVYRVMLDALMREYPDGID